MEKVPRRAVNLPPEALGVIFKSLFEKQVTKGPSIEKFCNMFGDWLGAPFIFGAASGRSAFQLALESLEIEKGSEIIFPIFTFPVMPMVAKILGYQPVFSEVDPITYNSGPEHIKEKITEKTGAVLATHLFGRPCPIKALVEITKNRNIYLIEDCAHACGVRVDGKAAGTFGDIGVFSFAVGKNMPCFGGGAIAVADEKIAERAMAVLSHAQPPSEKAVVKEAFSIWLKWFLTIPGVFGITSYPVLRLKQMLGLSLMDATTGDELLHEFEMSNPRVVSMANLQASMGLRQIDRIDAFNEGARQRADILTNNLGRTKDIQLPGPDDGNNIYVYYPLSVKPDQRDDLRHYLLRHGIDSKVTDMSDCSKLKPFHNGRKNDINIKGPSEASLLEICVYPMISENAVGRIADVIRVWESKRL